MSKTPSFKIPFSEIKDSCLGKKYELSLVFCDSKISKQLNKVYRDKNKPTNILSFPLSKTSGEIFIDLELVKKETKKFGQTFENLVAFLFIHGLFHLKGMRHGATMEKAEARLRQSYNIHGSSNTSRY